MRPVADEVKRQIAELLGFSSLRVLYDEKRDHLVIVSDEFKDRRGLGRDGFLFDQIYGQCAVSFSSVTGVRESEWVDDDDEDVADDGTSSPSGQDGGGMAAKAE